MNNRTTLLCCLHLLFVGWLAQLPLSGQHTNTAESPAFQLDLRGQRLAGIPLVQTIRPDNRWMAFAGALGDARKPFTVRIDVAHLDLSTNDNYYIEFELDPDSSTYWRRVRGGILGLGLVTPNRWRIRAELEDGHFILDESLMSSWSVGLFSSWAVPGNWTGFSYPLPLSEWTAGEYTYRIYREGVLIRRPLASGGILLNVLNPRHTAVFPRRPVLLLHGFMSGADFFADENSDTFVSQQSIGGRMASTRPSYTLEVPNIGDIREAADALTIALQGIASIHEWPDVDVIAHSMGGVVTRYAMQFSEASTQRPVRLGRFVALGSPFEGTMLGDFGDSSFQDPLTTAIMDRFGIPVFTWEKALRGFAAFVRPFRGVGSVAKSQLANPPKVFPGFWKNHDPNVRNDGDFLAVLGTNWWGISIVPALVSNSLTLSVFVEDLKTSLNMQNELIRQGVLWTPSDGLTTWSSGGKQPVSTSLNLYVNANHTGYNTASHNSDMVLMLDVIQSFLDRANVSGELSLSGEVEARSPMADTARLVESVVKVGGRTVANALVGIYDASKDRVSLISSLSGNDGRVFLPDRLRLGPSESLVTLGRGLEMRPFDAVSTEGSGIYRMSAVLEREIVVPATLEAAVDPTYSGPRDESILINGGAISTNNTTVVLTLNATGATEMRFGLLGEKSEWVPYTHTVSYTFASGEPGERVLYAEFRGIDGTIGTAVSASIIYNTSTLNTGTLRIHDDVGGSVILLNGRQLPSRTPVEIPQLPAGEYLVTLLHGEREFLDNSIHVELMPGEEISIEFKSWFGLWTGATNYGGGWKGYEWFGLFNDVGGGWIYHEEHGWWYVAAEGTASLWIYDAQLEVWAWTADWAYPWTYFADPVDAWTLYDRGGAPGNRWFFHTGAQEWRHEGALLNSW